MSKFSSFLRKFAPEYRELAKSLATVVVGIALNPDERKQVLAVTDMIQGAADKIEESIGAVEKAEQAGIDRNALKAAMRELLPDIIGGLSEAALRAMLEKKATKPAAVKPPKEPSA